jgi:hypothetical protein
LLVEIQIQHVLGDFQRTGIELGLHRRDRGTQAAVEAVAHIEGQMVLPVVVADVDIGAAGSGGLEAAHPSHVFADVEYPR